MPCLSFVGVLEQQEHHSLRTMSALESHIAFNSTGYQTRTTLVITTRVVTTLSSLSEFMHRSELRLFSHIAHRIFPHFALTRSAQGFEGHYDDMRPPLRRACVQHHARLRHSVCISHMRSVRDTVVAPAHPG